MKFIGLFIVVFGGLLATKLLGFSSEAQLFGAIVGSSCYILMQIKDRT